MKNVNLTIRLSILAILLSLWNPLNALADDGQWVLTNDHSIEGGILDMHFVNASNGWALTDQYIYRTSNGGEDWNRIFSQELFLTKMHNIFFITESNGWAVGDFGNAYRTLDGGQTWNGPFSTGVLNKLTETRFVNENIGWAIGTNGTILKTINGGDDWVLQSSTPNLNLSTMHFFDQNTGWVAGDLTVMRTTNGGTTWTTSNLSGLGVGFVYDLTFMDDIVGWMATQNGLYKTIDGGISWVQSISREAIASNIPGSDNPDDLDYVNDAYPTKISISSPTTIWVLGHNYYFELLYDRGSDNEGIIYFYSNGPQQIGFRYLHLHFVNSITGWVSGRAVDSQNAHFINKVTFENGDWNTNPQTHNSLSSVFFVDESNGWATGGVSIFGHAGRILKTTNGGQTWEYQLGVDYGESFKDIFFINNLTGWAVGPRGVIFKTTNGGNSWQSYDVGANTVFQKVFFLNITTGWITGFDGTIYKTTDGGNSWINVYEGVHSLFEIYFSDANNGWATGSNGTLLKTNNGGNSWVQINTPDDSGLFMGFANATTGWVSGTNSASDKLYKTTDGGQTWQTQTLNSNSRISSFHVFDENAAWLITYRGELFHTLNGGHTWRHVHTTNNVNISSPVFFYLHFASPTAGSYTTNDGLIYTFEAPETAEAVALMSPTENEVEVSTQPMLEWTMSDNANVYTLQVSENSVFNEFAVNESGLQSTHYIPEIHLKSGVRYYWRVRAENVTGASAWSDAQSFTTIEQDWNTQESPVDHTLMGVHFPTNQKGWAVGENGTILNTVNGGDVWKSQLSFSNEFLTDVHFANESTGWVSGRNGTLLRTINGGSTWTTSNTGTNNDLVGVHFVSNTTGWVAGQNGTILKTTNAGVSWNSQSLGIDTYFTDVFFLNDQLGWVVGTGGAVYQTLNGGALWKVKATGTSENLTAVHFIDQNNGWAVGQNGTILKTTNGGSNWTIIGSDTSVQLTDVKFTNTENGWIVGAFGTVLRTIDGENWTLENNSNTSGLNALTLYNAETGWAVGAYGTILRYEINDEDETNPDVPATGITFVDSNGNVQTLEFGFSELATNGYDSGIDQLAPPLPPTGIFDVRFLSGEPPVGLYKDIRANADQITEWFIREAPSSGAEDYLVTWNPGDLDEEGSYNLHYRWYTYIPIIVDMRLNNSAVIPAIGGDIKIVHTPETFHEVDVNYPQGWNMISMPADLPDIPYGELFPGSEPGTLFALDGGYTQETHISSGEGYWLYLNENESLNYNENLLTSKTYALQAGWNLIGSIGYQVAVNDITDEQNIIVPNSLFTYLEGTGYIPSIHVISGRGFWINAYQAGNITLEHTGSMGSTLAATPAFREFHSLSIQNENANPRKLYFAGDITDDMPPVASYELPPMPPADAFDIRFQNHTWLTEARETALLVQSPGETITLMYEASETEPEQAATLVIHRSGGITEDYQLLSGDSVTVDGTGITKVDVSVNTTVNIPGTGNELPQMLELAQNYPNPFNPTTNITFALPESGQVRLDVFNVMGQRVATLVNDQKPAGYHTVTFDASGLASGTYLYRLQSGNQVITKKLMLVK